MAELGEGQLAVVMPQYPHMMWQDRDVWTRFLEGERPEIRRVWYDVHVGQSVDVGPDGDELLRRISRGLTRKRIDVVARVGGGYWVIEVKPFAGMVALGQVLTYSRLFAAEYPVPGPIVGIVVCDSVDMDVMGDFEASGVGVFENLTAFTTTK